MLLLIETVYFYPVHFPGKPSCLCVRACHRQFSGLYFLDTQSFALCFFFPLSLLQGNRGGIIASVLQKYRLQFGGEKQFQTSAFIRGAEVLRLRTRDREHARACVNREPLAALVSGHSPICFQLGDSSLGKTEKLNSPVIPQMPRHGHAPPQTSDVWPASVLGRVRCGDGRAIYLPDGNSGAALRMSLPVSVPCASTRGPGGGETRPFWAPEVLWERQSPEARARVPASPSVRDAWC